MQKQKITVSTNVLATTEKVWNTWTSPEHIIKWNNASDEWHTPSATNDLRVGGKFVSRMEAKDGSMGFDFEGIYEEVEAHKKIAYSLGDGRKVEVYFTDLGHETKVEETFDPEDINPPEMQQGGWQSILNNFKNYTESI